MVVVGNLFLATELQSIVTNILTDVTLKTKVHLAKADITPTPNTVPADFAEADFTGYAAVEVAAWGSLHLDEFGQQLQLIATPVQFVADDAVTPNTIYAVYITSPDGDLVCAWKLDTPVPMTQAGATLTLSVGVAQAPWQFNLVILP